MIADQAWVERNLGFNAITTPARASTLKVPMGCGAFGGGWAHRFVKIRGHWVRAQGW
jgi:hypothetical protein